MSSFVFIIACISSVTDEYYCYGVPFRSTYVLFFCIADYFVALAVKQRSDVCTSVHEPACPSVPSFRDFSNVNKEGYYG